MAHIDKVENWMNKEMKVPHWLLMCGGSSLLFVLVIHYLLRKPKHVSKNITCDTTWCGEIILEEPVYVHKDAKLTIKPNTLIKAKENSALVICKDGELDAQGKEDEAIEFVRYNIAKPWYGLKLLGYTGNAGGDFEELLKDGPIYEASPKNWQKVVNANANAFKYESSESSETSNDNKLDFVRVVAAGADDINAITAYQASGEMNHIFVSDAGDDGIEFFAGDINLKNSAILGSADDGLDVDNGYNGAVDKVLILGADGSTSDLEAKNGDYSSTMTNIFYQSQNFSGNTSDPAASVVASSIIADVNPALNMHRS